jgi:MoaA/NifB/PqqE/SkfB family radical SAM enzyme
MMTAKPTQHSHSSHHAARDYVQTPLNIYWEMTQACGLACRHCRAEAAPFADPRELTTAEGLALIDQIRDFGDPLPQLILTGGDPLEPTRRVRADRPCARARHRNFHYTGRHFETYI